MNVLVVMTDQQRGDSLGVSGWSGIETPNLDALAASGTRWTRAHCDSPECVPARATVLTGLPPTMSGVVDNSTPLAEGAWTWPRALRAEGFRTWAVGKQHFRPHRADHGFDELELGEPLATTDDDYLDFLDRHGFGWVDEPWGVRGDSYYLPQPSQLPDDLHITTWTADRAIERLRTAATDDRPFAGFVGFLQPHPPFAPTVPFLRRYDVSEVPPPVDPEGDLAPFPVESAQNLSKWRDRTGPFLTRSLRAAYLACVTQVDAAIGRVLASLDELGLAESTVVVVVSDHGELLGDHGLWGKRSFLSGAAHIPLVIRAPGLTVAGTTNDLLVSHVDLAPTILAAVGSQAPAHLPGRSLLAADPPSPPAGLMGSYASGPRAVLSLRTDRCTWSYSVATGAERLFDLTADPDECDNLVEQDRNHPDAVESRRRVEDHLAELGDPLQVLRDGRLKTMRAEHTYQRHLPNRQGGRRRPAP